MSHRTGIQSTAGAVPIRTEKGFTMEKVKVTRYIAGKVPDYAQNGSGSSEASDESGDEKRRPQQRDRSRGDNFRPTKKKSRAEDETSDEDEPIRITTTSSATSADHFDARDALKDARLRRLLERSRDDDSDEDDRSRRRYVVEPEILERGAAAVKKEEAASSPSTRDRRRAAESSDEAEEDDLSEEEMERRRALIRAKLAAKEKEELMVKADESEDEEYEDEETEYEESESEDDELHRLKPVFVKKKDRVTLTDNEKEQQKQRERELRKKYEAEERKRQSAKLVESLVKLEMEIERKKQDDDYVDLNSVLTDDENEELAYEAWKVRELKRIKRAKEEKEQVEKEKAEIAKVHSMTEDERRAYLRANPKVVINKQQKGKYKFLQKYYHRGVYYLDEEDEVYKRNFAEATLEDHFDKSVLPKIMQVKDFGKAGRTKWTHLVSEDTTDFQSAWHADSAQNIKFFQKHGAAMKDVFERPAMKRRKK
uniref:Micro-fibrillar-associated protein 1 C-terminal domain-containing protein n=1 Tax=Romanomermis culicivorax TaxID=13658 RepID=A0A915HHK0_ROMCU